MIDLCTAGDLCWLTILSVPRIPLPGEVTPVKGRERLLGNDAAVVSLLASRLGLRCCLLATNAIATHDGLPLLDTLHQEGVDISLVNTQNSITPTTFFLSRVDSDERAWLVEDYAFHTSSADLFPAAKFFYIDIYEEHMEQRLALLQQWSQRDAHCLVNLSASHLATKIKLLARIPSIDTLQIRGNGSVDEARVWGRQILQDCHARAALITLGSAGAVLVEQQNAYHIPAEPIQPLRTIGAGASFAAGFLHALIQGATYYDAATLASKYAAVFCVAEKSPLEVIKR